MNRGPKINENTEETILELYKSHYSPKEISELLNLHYGTIAYRIQGFKIAKILKYNRLQLIPAYKLDLINKEISNNEVTK